MSHTLYPMRQPRLQRSELAVPGSNTSFIDKAADSAADFVFLDLEDAVAPPDKEQARRNVIEALREAEAQGKGAASVDGKMIDAASERMAQTVIAMDEAIRTAAASRV